MVVVGGKRCYTNMRHSFSFFVIKTLKKGDGKFVRASRKVCVLRVRMLEESGIDYLGKGSRWLSGDVITHFFLKSFIDV